MFAPATGPLTGQRVAAKETDDLLPDGMHTHGMLLLTAETASAGVIGTAWVALERDRTGGAWIYDIEIGAEQRGRGYGRALLEAIQAEVELRGGKRSA